jgi:hypothetical protein
VPSSGAETIVSSPPTAASRSRMLVNPTPADTARSSKQGPAHLEAQDAVAGELDHRGGGAEHGGVQ